MLEALFVSDIHLNHADDPKYASFVDLLKICLEVRPRHLFLVGDIFDLWIADRPYFVRRFERAAKLLGELVRAGIAVHYFEGNHDLDLRAYWEKTVGVRVYDEASTFSLAGLRVRVEHGDQMDPDDRGYLFLRWLLRTPVVRWLGRHLPNRVVAGIGEHASSASRGYTSTVKTVARERALEKMRAHGDRVGKSEHFAALVCGHTHLRADFILSGGARLLNLGTWLEAPIALALFDSAEWRWVSDFAELRAPDQTPER